MIAIGKIAFNEKDVKCLWWSDNPEGTLVVEFYSGDSVLIKNIELGNIVWDCLTDQKTRIDAKAGEVEWVSGQRGVPYYTRV